MLSIKGHHLSDGGSRGKRENRVGWKRSRQWSSGSRDLGVKYPGKCKKPWVTCMVRSQGSGRQEQVRQSPVYGAAVLMLRTEESQAEDWPF